MKKFLMFLLLASAAGRLYAGTVTDARIVEVYCGYFSGHSTCAIYFDQAIIGPATCHTETTHNMQITIDDPIGKALLDLAILAMKEDKRVDAGGKGSCKIINHTEDMDYILVKQ